MFIVEIGSVCNKHEEYIKIREACRSDLWNSIKSHKKMEEKNMKKIIIMHKWND